MRASPLWSRPARGAWVEISRKTLRLSLTASRAPQGARGLKFIRPERLELDIGRAPQGARGLKYLAVNVRAGESRRAPQGARGLKSLTR